MQVIVFALIWILFFVDQDVTGTLFIAWIQLFLKKSIGVTMAKNIHLYRNISILKQNENTAQQHAWWEKLQ